MAMRGEARVLRVALLSVLAALACDETQSPQAFLWEETFEEVCDDDLPCGWAQVGGAPGDARYVMTTLHPGEHGLSLTGDASVRGPGGPSDFSNFQFGSLEVRVTGRCDAAAGISVLLGLAETNPDGTIGRVDMTMPASIFLPATWAETSESIVVTSEGAFTDAGLSPPLTAGTLQVTSVTLTMNGPGTCEIAEILIDDPMMTVRFRDDGC
jgi:hypothetical protein